jgi:hypothetical protein
MKQVVLSILISMITIAGFTQGGPVNFDYQVKKVKDKVYEVSVIVTIARPWHIYSQFTPVDAPSLRTTIKFVKNPLVEIVGMPVEKGALITKHDEVLNTDFKYFLDKVEFVQQVKLKAYAKTNLGGSVHYMVCTDSQCLMPTTVSFNVVLN